jgi:hypothetical protein
MKTRPHFLGLLCLTLMLSGCGDSLTAGGASLGGTGSTPGGTDAHPTDPMPEDKLNYLHTIHYHEPITDQCGSLQRTIYFHDAQGNPVTKAQTQETFTGRVEVTVELENKGPFLLEKITSCQSPIGLFNTHDAKVGDQAIDCDHDADVTWRHLASQKPARYRFVAYLPYMAEQYYLNYTAAYVQPNPKTAIQDINSETPATLKCEPLKIPFELVKVGSDATDIDIPNDDGLGDPISDPVPDPIGDPLPAFIATKN